MKYLSKILFNCSMLLLIPAAAGAAGTYYTGNYQSPQMSRYTQKSYAGQNRATNYSTQGVSAYTRNQYANAGYNTTGRAMGQTQNYPSQARNAGQDVTVGAGKSGLFLNAGMSMQNAMWQFEMASAGSKLRYDDINWLVFDVDGKYIFDAGNTKMQIDAGLQYGMQFGESTMVDDDISHGGYINTEYVSDVDGSYVGASIGHAASIGVSKDGSMFGFNAGIGLTDFFSVGNLKITPSVGWRYFQHKLETSDNKGTVFINGDWAGQNSCISWDDGVVECLPLIGVSGGVTDEVAYPGYTYFDKNGQQIPVDANGNLSADPYYVAVNVSGGNYAFADGTFYFEQSGVSHSYEVEWSGPYFALDMLYDINQNNTFNAFVELGLPSYKAVGDQPYRTDWAHPKSVEDEGGIGSAIHFGAGANWTTAITDTVAFSIGVTFDYYKVKDADATTYLNEEYWTELYTDILGVYVNKYGLSETAAEDAMLNGNETMNIPANQTAQYIYSSAANGWKDSVSSEIEAFYKSLGVRVGLNVTF